MASNDESSRKRHGYSYSSNDEENKSSNNNNKDSGFECNICFELAKNAVLSRCGHLFCWPCIHQWLEVRGQSATCPICKSAISRESLTPIYGRNGSQADPRDTVPPRPSGTREEAQTQANRSNSFFGDGVHFHMSFGIGAFPFGIFQTSFANGNHGDGSTRTNVDERFQQELLSQILLVLAIFVIIIILFG